MPGVEIVSYLVAHPEWGWLLVISFGVEQLFAPWQTRTKKLVGRIEKRIKQVESNQTAQMTVIRAIARTNEEIDTKEVDRYLVANGAEPDDFIKQRGGESDGAD